MSPTQLLKSIARAIKHGVLNFGVWRSPHGTHITRYYMYRRLEGLFHDEFQGRGKKILCISHSQELADLMGLKDATMIEANYPDHNITDLTEFESGQFDYIVSNQVLEHIEGNPQKAFDESMRVLKPGGVAVHTTCFINPIHGAPSDFWRFTPKALRLLAADFSEIISVEGWGNRAVWIADFLGLRYVPIPHAPWHPLHKIATKNNTEWPIVTWIVARK